jgi:glycosyltransferase involved in cell wall biosynthesis
MKILHIITHLAVGGATYNTIINSHGHILKGCEVDVLAGYDDVMEIEGDLLEFAQRLRVKVTIIKNMRRKISLWDDFISFLKIYFYIKKGKYDIVHTHSSKAGVLGRVAARIAGVKVIVHTVHGWSFNDSMTRVKKNIYVCLERLLVKITSKLVVVTKMDITKGIENKIGSNSCYELIRSGIDIDFFKSGTVLPEFEELIKGSGAEVVIGTVGRLSQQKAPLDFVRMADFIVSKNQKVRFVMVGDGILREDVENEISRRKLGEYIFILGKSDNIPALLAGLDIFVLTSHWEGLPRVIPEAMAAGVPVISTSVDGAAEIIEHGVNGFLVETGDMEQMAQFCLDLIRDRELGKSLSIGGLKTVNDFSHQKMADDLFNLFNRLYDNRA